MAQSLDIGLPSVDFLCMRYSTKSGDRANIEQIMYNVGT